MPQGYESVFGERIPHQEYLEEANHQGISISELLTSITSDWGDRKPKLEDIHLWAKEALDAYAQATVDRLCYEPEENLRYFEACLRQHIEELLQRRAQETMIVIVTKRGR